MMSSTLGAPLGGTTRGAHQGVDSVARSLITPPNFGSGGGSCFPSIVVVALGDPGVPVTCCAAAGMVAISKAALNERAVNAIRRTRAPHRLLLAPLLQNERYLFSIANSFRSSNASVRSW